MQQPSPSSTCSLGEPAAPLAVFADESVRTFVETLPHANTRWFGHVTELKPCLADLTGEVRVLVILPDHHLAELPSAQEYRSLELLPFASDQGAMIPHFLENWLKNDPSRWAADRDVLASLSGSGTTFLMEEALSGAFAQFDPDLKPASSLDLAWQGHHLCTAGSMGWRLAQAPTSGFQLDGQLALKGRALVAGQAAPDAREALYRSLECLTRETIVLALRAGRIETVTALNAGSEQAAAALLRLFEENPAYHTLQTIGFALDKQAHSYAANTPLNGACGAPAGALFLELGRAHDPYHLRLFSSETIVSHNDTVLLGKKKMKRRKAASCPCLDF